MGWFVLVCLALIGALWWAMANSPTVDPDHCHLPEVACGDRDCGGPCRTKGPLPCATSAKCRGVAPPRAWPRR